LVLCLRRYYCLITTIVLTAIITNQKLLSDSNYDCCKSIVDIPCINCQCCINFSIFINYIAVLKCYCYNFVGLICIACSTSRHPSIGWIRRRDPSRKHVSSNATRRDAAITRAKRRSPNARNGKRYILFLVAFYTD